MSEYKNIFIDLKKYVDATLKKYKELFDLIDLENYPTSVKLELKQQISHIESISNTSSQNPYQVSSFWNGAATSIKNIIHDFEKYSQSENIKNIIQELNIIAENIISISKNTNFSDLEINNQFENYLETKNKNLNSNFENLKKSDEQKKLATSFRVFEKLIEEQKLKVDTIISSSLEKIEETNRNLEEFKNYLENETPLLKQKLETTNNFFANVGGAKLAEHYLEQSNNEKILANRFRIAFISSFIVIFCFLLIASTITYTSSSQEEGLNFYIKRAITYIPILLLFSAGATYLIKESNKHRLRQNTLNDKYLALSTIDLYISTLESKDQTQIKNKLSEYFFSSQYTLENSKDGFAIDPQETINRLIDAVSKAKK